MIRVNQLKTTTLLGLLSGLIVLIAILSFGALYGPVTYDNRRNSNPIGLLFLIILAPLSAVLIQLAISRTREYAADQGSAELTGNPLALVNALRKLEQTAHRIPMHGNPAFSPLLIINPLLLQGLHALFLTHPPIEERIRRLKEWSEQRGLTSAAVISS